MIMGKSLRILNIEDQERDVSLITRHLTRAGYEVFSHRVDAEKELHLALEGGDWDVILCDYSMPKFNALAALRIVKELSLDIPFIIISGTVGEAVAVEAMRAGAHDYLMKDNLVRLAATIERELQDTENRRARWKAEEQREQLVVQLESERRRLDTIVGNVPGIVWETFLEHPDDTNQDFVSEYVESMLGYTTEDWLSTPGFWLTIMHPDDQERMRIESIEAFEKGEQQRSEFRLIAKEGHDVWVESHSAIIKDGAGKPIGLRGVTIDISERKQAEAALRAAEEKYRSIFENAVEGIFQATPEGRYVAANPAMARILGYGSVEEFLAERICFNPENYVVPGVRETIKQILEDAGLVAGFECEVVKKDGTRINTIQNVRAIHDDKGKLLHYEGSIEDVTERKMLETQLRQSQKLEAVGMLAGGIAHDFNNLLTVIGGYSDLTLTKLRAEDPLRRHVTEISKASDRAAVLTRQLLAFSRKQVLQPKVLDLNSIVGEMEKLLRRLIGEDVKFRAVFSPEIGSVKADPGQIEQVIMNLAVNSRDAMPNGGTLTIETGNVVLDEEYARTHVTVPPGHYVLLAVSDSGCGMDSATQARIFEPFFTTKEQGKGTGLGLSTVYGIVKQSGGSIWVYSEPGRGTTFKVYLPRVDEVPTTEVRREIKETIKGSETILLAEDEEMVRELSNEVLVAYGYKVLEAANGGAALLICERYEGEIDLLLTDVVMPEMSGPELAQRLKQLRPNMKVLYMSGYTDNAIVHQGVLDEGANFIQKPFAPVSLAEKVHSVLTPEESR
jgi:two-component system cell cycle sensor histidine kinase/response regulator CckA